MVEKSGSSQLRLRIAQQIVDYCGEENLPVGARLTERNLCGLLGVSRSPVRAALKLLADKQVVDQVSGRGYFLRCAGDQLGQVLIRAPRPPSETLYERILRDCFAGSLPKRLSEADLMRRYAVTRSVLMKAIMRMSQEGLVQRSQGHGWIFSDFLNSAEAYRASYEYRKAIEPAAIRSQGFNVDAQKLANCIDQHVKMQRQILAGGEQLTSAEHFELDAELHEMIAGFSGNQFFINAVKGHNHLRRIVEYESFYKDERMQESCEEHLGILRALQDNQIDWAAVLMARHLELSGEALAAFESS